ncbi:homocitrate synthase mitochondrial [Fusarium sp. NRRL 52700]|nr:homocitrate synthase mitochondrial [Fusarium sp. NRRL 52700]
MCGTDDRTAGAAVKHPAQNQNPATSAYSQVQDYLSNVNNYKIIESTLREGEQFANAWLSQAQKIKIAKMLDEFGVDYIELTSVVSSPAAFEDCKAICNLGLKTKILTHVRCNMDDAKKAVEAGVDGVDLVIGTSSLLREHSHGKSMEIITKTALEVIEYVKSKGVEVRFSSEDSFRSDLVDILALYKAVDKAGVDRVGVADTVGGATPRMVYDLIRTLRGVVGCDIGCAVANALMALEAGASHIDTSILGIGERNGITPLYNLKMVKELDEFVASVVEVNIPFSEPISGFCAFTHKAGIHAKAILANPSTYEIIDPTIFGLTRYISVASRVTGWHAVKSRVVQLGLEDQFTDDEVKAVTAKVKQMGDVRPIAIDDVDSLIHAHHLDIRQGREGSTALEAPETA